MMRTSLRLGAAIVCLVAATAVPAAAGETAAAPSPGAALRADLLGNFDYTIGHVRDLAAAIPADKYGWRPGEGVRSVAEVVGHIAASNYFLTSFLGVPMPAGISGEDTQETDPAKLRALLDASVAHVHKVVDGLSDADLDKQVEFFGNKMSERAVLLVTLGHVHEHLGQLIAYARTNGVVPPWSMAPQSAGGTAKASGGKSGE